MKDFDIAKYLRENHLGSHAILGAYVDLHALKEEDYGNNKPVDEVPYVGTDDKLDGFGDEFDQVEPVSELEKPENIYADDEDDFEPGQDRMMDLGGEQIEQGIISLLDDGFEPEDILDACKMFIDAHVNAAMQGKKF